MNSSFITSRQGPISIAGSDGNAYFYTDETRKKKTYPDIQIVFFSRFIDENVANFNEDVAQEYLAKNSTEEGINIAVLLAHPQSTGTIKLKSGDPFDHPVINPQFFTDKDDITKMIAGIRIWERLAETATFKKLGYKVDQSKLSFCAQHDFRSDAYWECYIRHLGITVWHQCGTCKMGLKTDPTTVVDPQLRVNGIKGLRVVDASVFPRVTSGNIQAPVIMVAEKAADIVRGIDSVKYFRRNLPKNK